MSVSGRRSYLPAHERREQILDVALEIFAEKGYHAASVADVCGRAGIGRGTLYQYFGDKRALLVALADRIIGRVEAAFTSREPLDIPEGFRPNEAAVVAFLEARFVQVLRIVFEDAATTRLLLRTGRGADGVVDDMLRSIDETMLGRMEDELRLAKRAGVLRDIDERFVARFFLGGVEKLTLMYLDDDRPVDVEAIAREAALLEVCGIYRRDSAPDKAAIPQEQPS